MGAGLAGEVAKHAVVVANGEHRYRGRLLAVARTADVLIAADGGANWLAEQGLAPHVLVGDQDSVAPSVLGALREGRCRLVQVRRDKDETDTELALLESLAAGATRITILGALGGRVDHALANVLLLAMPQLRGVQAVIYDGRSYLSLVQSQASISGEAGDVISLIPVGGDAVGVITEGLQYPLRGETLYLGLARGVSNVLLQSEGQISLRSGMLLLVHTPRRHLATDDDEE